MKHLFALIFISIIALTTHAAGNYQWINPAGGNWFVNSNWSPAQVPGPGDGATINLPGTYTVVIPTGTVSVAVLNLGGAASGTQTLIQGSSSVMAITNSGTVGANGILLVTNQGLSGRLTIQAGGEMQIATAAGKQFYGLNLVNEGTVTWADGWISVGGSGAQTTIISNGGLWQITGDVSMNYGGGTAPVWTNSGTLRKSGGTGSSGIYGVNFVNLPGGLVDILAGTLNFSGINTNPLGGTFTATVPGTIKIMNGIWTDAGGTFSGTGTNQFTGDTLLLRTNSIPGLKIVSGDVYIASTFQESGTITNLILDGANLRGTNTVNHGTLTMNGGNVQDKLTILPAGQLVLTSSATKLFYSTTLINQGTVTWTAGSINVGGTPPTVISNGGLWQIVGDLSFSFGGGFTPSWTNTGILRKTAGTGLAGVDGFNFDNQPGGLIDAPIGIIRFTGGNSSLLGGTFNATAPGLVEIGSGTWTDAGGTTTGTGTNRLNGGTFNFRTNIIAGLRLTGGNLFIVSTNTFQQAGAITNLTLEGSSLLGTNRIGDGTLTMNAGSISGALTVQAGGQLKLATGSGKNLSSLSLINQGTVLWSGGNLSFGSTPTTTISNGGLWQITGDDSIFYNGVGPFPAMTNSGTLWKSAGTGTSVTTGMNFYNQSSGLVQVDTGTLQFAGNTTNTAGIWRLNGGKLSANGALGFNGGTLDGTGAMGASTLNGGLISPGQSGAGLIGFASGLSLGSNATLAMDGTGTTPGSQYDQISVTGAVSIANSTLSVISLPPVALGTTFILINNDGADAVTGTFNGLPENSLLTISGQLFRLRYSGGTGNDVALVRYITPLLSSAGTVSNGVWRFSGTGIPSSVYAIQASTNFIQWTNIGFATGDVGGNFIFPDTNAFRFSYRFYRTTN
ncbi:MAG: hypothetical protein WDM76_02165 [Limisphaerales bacterium]